MSEVLLKLENAAIGYADKTLIRSIQAEINAGEFVVVLGKNGVGKSTLMQTILGQLPLINGNLFYGNKIVTSLSPKEIAQQIAVVFSKLQTIPAIKVVDILKTGRIPHYSFLKFIQSNENIKIDEVLNLVGISDLKNSYLNELSEGQLQLVVIARALMQDTPMLILDEPTANLDLENQLHVFRLIQRLKEQTNKAIVMITHEAQLGLKFADKIWWVEDEQLYQGLPESIAHRFQIISKLSGDHLQYNAVTASYEIESEQHFQPLFELSNDLAYWLHQALNRKQIGLTSLGLERLEIKANHIIFEHQTFESIDSFLNYIQQHEKYYYNRSK